MSWPAEGETFRIIQRFHYHTVLSQNDTQDILHPVRSLDDIIQKKTPTSGAHWRAYLAVHADPKNHRLSLSRTRSSSPHSV